jgi:hypothetical protein
VEYQWRVDPPIQVETATWSKAGRPAPGTARTDRRELLRLCAAGMSPYLLLAQLEQRCNGR